MADPRGRAQGAQPSPVLFLDQTEGGLNIQKDFFWRLGPRLTKGLDDRPTPLRPPSSQGLDPARVVLISS